MRTLQMSFPATVLLALLVSCSAFERDGLRVLTFSPSGRTVTTSIVEVTFSRAVVAMDSTNVWTDQPFIAFEPAIPGKFVWQDTSRLVFSPDAPLPGDMEFRASLNTELLTSVAGTPSIGGTTSFEFSTEPFLLKIADFYYDRIDNRRSIGVRANLEFTYTVEPEMLAKHMQIEIEGKRHTDVRVTSTTAAKVMTVEIGSLQQLEEAQEIEVGFDGDLTSVETGTRLAVTDPITYSLPGLEELKILGHVASYDGKKTSIRIQTSQEVDPGSVSSFVAVEPQRPFTVESGGASSFVLHGPFEIGQTFKLTIRTGLESLLGGKTKNEYTADVFIGNLDPSFGFDADGSYLLLGGARSLGIRSVNLDSVTLRVSQVFRNNIVYFMTQGRSYNWEYVGDEDGGGDGYRRIFRYTVGPYGRRLETTHVRVDAVQNTEVVSQVDVAPYLRNDFKGFLMFEISNPNQAWRTTSKLVVVSDIGLIVKRSDRAIDVYAVNLVTTEPMQGATISLVSTSNQTLVSAFTDGDGRVSFRDLETFERDFNIAFITASQGEDFTFLHLRDSRVETSRFDVGGNRDSDSRYDAFLYGDRTLYRPGEKMVVSGIVRQIAGPLPSSMPVTLTVYDPSGAPISKTMHTLNEQGSFETVYQTRTTSRTGEYRVELRTGDDSYLSSTKVSVEEFVPDRLRISMHPSVQSAAPGETVSYSFEALNFFGPPAAGRSFEFETTFIPAPFHSERFPDFRFSNDAMPDETGTPMVDGGKTDPNGKGTVSVRLPGDLSSRGVIRARGRVSVFDESGRPVHQVSVVTVHPNNRHIGIKRESRYYVPPRVNQQFQAVAVDGSDTPLEGLEARLEIVRREWHSVLRSQGRRSGLRYISEKRDIVVERRDVVLGKDPVTIPYTVPRSGDYAIRLYAAGANDYAEFTFYSYEWATASITSFKVDPEARVDIVPDKDAYEPGEQARLLFQTPFDGKMLVTLERNGVTMSRFVTVRNNSASLDVPLDEQHMPNTYVSAVLFRSVKEQTIPLLAGHGFVPLRVEKAENRLSVTITAPEKIRPRRTQTVVVNAGGQKDVFVTLAAVDEGILQLKRFESPDPYGHFYARKALQTETFDFFKDLLPEPKTGKASSTGGDADIMAQRVNPFSVQRFKPVALWSGILRTDDQGNAEVNLDVPEFSGELRLMAIAYKNDRFGSASRPMTVTDPVVITPALPRFLSPGDEITMPITAFNTTDSPVSLSFAVSTEGPVSASQPSTTLEVGPHQERFIETTLHAGEAVGNAVIRVTTTVRGETMESVTELSVRPVSSFTMESKTGWAVGGSPVAEELPDAYLPYGRRAYVTLSPFPVVTFAKDLKYLIGYPHGCIEQTTSKAFPQVYLRDLALVLDPSILERGSPAYFVNEAIDKISRMQQDDGSFSYWPGGGSSHPWSTVYATHFLAEARRAGYAVSDAVLQRAIGALSRTARNKQTFDYRYHEGIRTTVRRIADKSAVYALYVLALTGNADLPLMSFYRSSPHLLAPDTRALLAGAYAHSGDRKTFLELIQESFNAEPPERTSGRWFDSPVRSTGIILNVLLDVDPDNINIARYMDALAKLYGGNPWLSTQDRAFTLLAFGKAARRAGTTTVTGVVRAGGMEFRYDGGNKRIDLPVFSGKVTISLTGEGRVAYAVVSEGIRKDSGPAQADNNMTVRRQFLDRFGKTLNVSQVAQNDLMVVRLSLRADTPVLENIAISDLLPGGFEIENSRLTEVSRYEFLKDADEPTYVDIRDDRINFYTNIYQPNDEQVFYYMVRAVTKGSYAYPAVTAGAMYDGAYTSVSGKGNIRVTE